MPCSFFLPVIAAPLVELILSHPELVHLDSPSLGKDRRWPEGESLWFAAGRSIRAISVTHSSQGFTLALAEAAAPPDYQLLISLVDALADSSGCNIQLEDGRSLSRDDFLTQFDSQWQRQQAQHSLQKFVRAWKNSAEVIDYQAANTHVALGPRLLGQLLQDSKTFSLQFFSLIRLNNSLALSGLLHKAAKAEMTLAGSSHQVAQWLLNQDSALPFDAEYILLSSTHSTLPVLIQQQQLRQILPKPAQDLDETHFYLAALDTQQQIQLMADAHTRGGQTISIARAAITEAQFMLPTLLMQRHPSLIWTNQLVNPSPKLITASSLRN